MGTPDLVLNHPAKAGSVGPLLFYRMFAFFSSISEVSGGSVGDLGAYPPLPLTVDEVNSPFAPLFFIPSDLLDVKVISPYTFGHAPGRTSALSPLFIDVKF